jgi:peptide/nickel transport system ATP-binding protein
MVQAPVQQALPEIPAPPPLLEARDLHVHFPVRKGLLQRITGHIRAVDGVSFDA